MSAVFEKIIATQQSIYVGLTKIHKQIYNNQSCSYYLISFSALAIKDARPKFEKII